MPDVVVNGVTLAYDVFGEGDPAKLEAVEVPSLVIAFERDLLMPPTLAKEVAAKIWNCQYAELPGGGHWRLVLDPPEVHIRVLAFLEEVLGGLD